MLQEPKNIVVFDIEATGLSAEKDQILEIGAVLLEDREIVDRFQTFVSIKGGVPEQATKLTGITNLMLQGQPGIQKALLMFKNFIKDYPLFAHNASFDYRFIQAKCKETGIVIDNDVYDTLKMARELLPTASNHKLDTLCGYFGVANDNHHRADNDSEALSKILIVFLESLKRRGQDIGKFKVNI